MEIKHGRAAMLGFLHVIAIEAGVRVPGYLSVSQDLKFSDVPAGCFASLEAVPTAGWLQIMVLTFAIAVHSTGGVGRPAKVLRARSRLYRRRLIQVDTSFQPERDVFFCTAPHPQCSSTQNTVLIIATSR